MDPQPQQQQQQPQQPQQQLQSSLLSRFRSALLTLSSFLLTGVVIGNAFFQRGQFYPSVVYITKSNPSMAVIYVQAFVFVILIGKAMRKIFFGRLRAAEFEHLMERSWYAVTETCLAFTVFKDDFSPKFVALFTLLLFLKSFHWLSEDRVDFMERSPSISALFHLRVISLNLLLAAIDIRFVLHAYESTLTKGPSVQLVFGFEYAVLLTIVANTLVKYVLHTIDLRGENPWENKAVFMLYTELVVGFVKVILYVVFIAIMIRIYTLPLFAVRPMYLTMRAFKKALNDVILSRRAIHNMNTWYPDATEEELQNSDNVCIICRDEMVASPSTKKLPCNHIFHKNCLRSWFQRQQTCPTCRLDVLRSPSAAQVRQQHLRQQQQQAGQQQQQQPNNQPFDPQAFFAQLAAAMPPPQQRPPQPQPAQASNNPQQQQQQQQQQPMQFPPPPPFPMFAPFGMMPSPPMPPPNFQGLTQDELLAMEGNERKNVEARIKCLRNIQVLLDAAVLEMQQYSAVVARHVPENATTSTTTTTDSNNKEDKTDLPTEATGAKPKIPKKEKEQILSRDMIKSMDEMVQKMDKADKEADKTSKEADKTSKEAKKVTKDTEKVTKDDDKGSEDELRKRRLAKFEGAQGKNDSSDC